jgi:hypothetical protein
MVSYLKKDVEISRWSAARAGFALAGYAKTRPGVHSRWYLDGELPLP